MRQQGVTLIQMMFALAVAALLTHLGATAYNRMSEDLHQAAVARALAQALRDARNQAALRHQAVRVQPLQREWGQGWQTTLERSGRLLSEYRPTRPTSIEASDTRMVRFSARGVPLGMGFGGITLHICQRTPVLSRHQVVLSPSGRVSLRSEESPGCAGR